MEKDFLKKNGELEDAQKEHQEWSAMDEVLIPENDNLNRVDEQK